MIKIKTALILLALSFSACKNVKHYNNRTEDLKSATKIVDSFFTLEKQGRYDDLYKLFTLGNSGLTQNQLNATILNIIRETNLKDGSITKCIDMKCTSRIQESGDEKTGEYYVEVINERSIVNTKETFKLMLIKNSIKIYDYQILIGSKKRAPIY